MKAPSIDLAYAWTLQYWAEEASLLASSEPYPLAMSLRELRQHIGKHTIFTEHDVFKGLGNAMPEAEDGDMGTPPVDSTASPTTTNIRNTQPSPIEVQLADDTISPLPEYQSEAKTKDKGTPPADSTTSPAMADAGDTQSGSVETPMVDNSTEPVAEPDVEIQKDLLTAWGASPAELEDQVTPNAMSVDKLAGLPTPTSHMVRERQEYPQWIKVHSSLKVAAVGGTPSKSGEPRWHHNCSSKQCKRV